MPPFADAADTAPRLRFLDHALIVVDKPAGLLCVPGRGAERADCLALRVQARWPDALVVHRLDMATSGLVAFARGKAAQRSLGIAFAARRVDKRYVAVVEGRIAADAGDDVWHGIDLPLAADWPNRPRQKVDAVHGKPSLTRWRVLGAGAAPTTTRLALWPLSGRSHQLRVHLQAIGHPIVGDALYGLVPTPSDALAATAPRLLLHASGLELPHPDGGPNVVAHSEPPF